MNALRNIVIGGAVLLAIVLGIWLVVEVASWLWGVFSSALEWVCNTLLSQSALKFYGGVIVAALLIFVAWLIGKGMQK